MRSKKNKFTTRKTFIVLILILVLAPNYLNNLYNYDFNSKEIEKEFNLPKLSDTGGFRLQWAAGHISGEGCYEIATRSSENIYMAVQSDSYDGYILKYDKNANILWEQSDESYFRCVALDGAENAYIAGYDRDPSNPYESLYDIVLLKYNRDGVFQWKITYNIRENEEPCAMILDRTGSNLFIVGKTYDDGGNQDIFLLRASTSGGFYWHRILDLSYYDEGTGVAVDSSNNVYICGYHGDSSSSNDILIAKYNDQGTIQWSKIWGSSSINEEAHGIDLDVNRNIYITGIYRSTDNNVFIGKFDSSGNELWTKQWGGSSSDRGFGIDVYSGDIYITGSTREQSAGSDDILFLIYNTAGTYQWWGRYGRSTSDIGKSIQVADSKNVYIGGLNIGYSYLLKYNPSPIITINSPSSYELFSHDPPTFNVSITDNDLESQFYRVNGGTSHTFSGTTGTIDTADWDACSNGTVSLRFYAKDSVGNTYEEVIVRKDILGPIFEIRSPLDNNLFEDVAPDYELFMDVLDYDSIWYTINGTEKKFITSLTGTLDQSLWDSLGDGSLFLRFYMNDSLGNIAFNEVQIFKNYHYPIIVINAPLNNQLIGNKAPNYSLKISSLSEIDKIWYSLNSGSNQSLQEESGNLDQTVWDIYGNGTVTITFYANNTIGKTSYSDVIVRKDIYFPIIEIYYPNLNEEYGLKAPDYHIYVSSVNRDSMWYTLNHGTKIYITEFEGRINQTEWDLYGNETITITFYANNSYSDLNYNEIIIQKITITPNITIISPLPYEVYGLDTIDFEIYIEDNEINTSWYNLNSGANYIFTGYLGTIDFDAWDTCGNGTVTIRFYVNNSIGNIGSAEVTVHKDIYFPSIEVYKPEQNFLFGNLAPDYNITVTTTALDSIWYTLNGDYQQIIINTYGTIDQNYWDLCSNGTVIITFYANNTYGQMNYVEISVRKDTSIPNITIYFPLQNDIYGIGTINYNVSIEDPKLDSYWYMLNGKEKIFFEQMTGIIDQAAWEGCGNGTIIITFYANNSVGNIGSSEVLVHRDIYFPFIEVYTPIQNQLCGNVAPNYNFSVSTSALHTLWYTLNSGFKNIILSTEGAIDQVLWDSFGEGNIEIKFYANNTYGQTNYLGVIVEKLTHIIKKNAYAIIIGISNYPGSDYDLNYCDDDALAVYNMLIDEYNFKPENIIYLEDSAASKNGIDNAFNTISSIINPDDIFYFYYSGHGGADISSSGPSTFYLNSPHPYPNDYDHTWWISSTDAAYIRVHFEIFDLESGYDYLYLGDAFLTEGYYYQSLSGYGTNFWSDWIPVLNDNRIYLRMITDYSVYAWGFRIDQIEVMRYSNPHFLCSYDSIPSSPGNYYVDSLLDSRLDSLNCDNKYVILDSCNSGGMIPESQDTNRFIMTACKGGQFSMEEPALTHGIFTYYLVNSLDNANDQNSDGVLSMEEIFSYVSSGTRSYSASYGPGIQYHPQLYDGINGQAVLYPSIGSISITPVDNQLYYSFYLYGHGSLKTLNLTVCSISPTITFKTEELKNQIISPTGFGYYSGFIEFEEGYIAGGIQLLAEIEGNRLIVIDLTIGDSDGDGLADFFEILQGLDPNSNDTDSDGLSDYDEYYGPTDPLNNDTDSDGLLDGEEVNIYGTDPLNSDTDSDGLTDGEEVNIYGTDPLNEDTDSDIMPDGWEVMHSLNPLVNDSALDPDMDLLTNLGEYYHNTHPQDPDTDDDGLLDGEEVHIYFTDPLEEDTDSDGLLDGEEVNIYGTDPVNNDTDSDGLSDGEEVNIYGTDPLDEDTDSDTMPDKWEIDNMLDPLVNDTALDPDNDLLINVLEYQYGTDPQNPDTDGDGWTDGDEVNHGTDPLDPDSHPTKKSEVIPGYIISLLLAIFSLTVLFLIKKKQKYNVDNK